MILSTLAILLKQPFTKSWSFGAGRSRSSTATYPHHGRAHPRNGVLAPRSSMLQPSGDERSPSIYASSQLVTSVMPGVSEQTYWLLVEKMGPSTIYNICPSVTFVDRGTFTHTNGPKPWLYQVTHMTESLQDPSLRDYGETHSPEQMTRRLSQRTFGVETQLTRTKRELNITSPRRCHGFQISAIKIFSIARTLSCDLPVASLTAEVIEKRID